MTKHKESMAMLALTKQHIYFIALLAALALVGATVLDQYQRFAKQAKIAIGDTFPALKFQSTVEPFAPKGKQILFFARNGCAHCKHLEGTFSAVFDSLNKPDSWKSSIVLVSLDESPQTTTDWASTATYDSDDNNLYFNSTPQLYFLDENRQVIRKFVGALPKEKLAKELTAFLK